MNIFQARSFSKKGARSRSYRLSFKAGLRTISGFIALLATTCFAGRAFSARVPPPTPSVSIPLDPIGFRPIGRVYMLYPISSVTLDFIDDKHLLFSFHRFTLMSREDEVGHDDQTIRAVVLEIPSGKVQATADWRMHDRRPYLFSLGNGDFLLRQGSQFDLLDRTLKTRPFIRLQHRVETAQLSADGKMLTIQTDLERHSPEKHKSLLEESLAEGAGLPDEDVDVQMVELDQKRVVGEAKSSNPIHLAVTSDGYVDHREIGGGKWKIRFHPFEGKVKDIAQVSSTCAPSEDFITSDVVLLNYCNPLSSNRYAVAVSTDGKQLWNGEWGAQFISPSFGSSMNGDNFAVSWIVATHAVDAFFSLADGDVQGQLVQALSTSTGHLLLSVPASPIVSVGRNFALSNDGSRLAVLNAGRIELYDVPADKIEARKPKK